MAAEKLTTMQSDILVAMKRGDLAAFTGNLARKYGFGICRAKDGGVVIRAYSNPQWFLVQRGLIEPKERDVPGQWYQITPKGRAAVQHKI
jgi:hypothetical protein